MENISNHHLYTNKFRKQVKERSDNLINYFLLGYFVLGIVWAFFYDTWFIALSIGSLSLTAYYSVKLALPDSNLYQYVLSLVLGIFMAQYIYQMHGMFEMHFFAFIGSAIIITYQNWKLQIPMLLFVAVHHGIFGYLQNFGIDKIYFTQVGFFELQTFIIHIILATAIFLICGLWAYQLKKNNEVQILQTIEMERLQKEVLLSIERKRSEEILQQKNMELKKSNLELDKFVYSVSHDLRAPLTSILGLIQISEDEEKTPFLANNIDLIRSSVHKLDNFILDILNYSRNSRIDVVLEEIDFSKMVNEIAADLRNMSCSKPELKINVYTSGEVPFVSDKKRISVVMNNLISNAIRYKSPKSTNPFLNITLHTGKNETSIVVEDNGIGIRKEVQPKIFNMFYRATQSSDGTGLGLYIVKQIVEKLGGKIEVDSELGEGATFTIRIPRQSTGLLTELKTEQLCLAG